MKVRHLAVATLIGTGLLAACGGGSSTTGTNVALAVPCQSGTGVNAHATTNSYVIQLNVGSVEAMFSQAQVDAQHLTSGEVMLRGQMSSVGPPMSDMPGMTGTASSSDHHLEAHICSKTTGAPVLNANPTITLIDAATPNVSADVPIAVMQGIGQGVSDYHYGNNVLLAPGGSYTVIVALNGEKATLHITLPAAAAGTTGTPTTTSATPTTMGGDMGGMPGMGGTTVPGTTSTT